MINLALSWWYRNYGGIRFNILNLDLDLNKIPIEIT